MLHYVAANIRRDANKRKAQAISTRFTAGNGSGALSVKVTDTTLGASVRKGYRMAVTPAERTEHGSTVTKNTAGWTCSGERPLADNGHKNRLGRPSIDHIGAETITPKSNVQKVKFEHRVDHLCYGKRA